MSQGADKVQDKNLSRAEFYKIRTTLRSSVERLDWEEEVGRREEEVMESVFSAAKPEAPETP
jgi:hypothetical protein